MKNNITFACAKQLYGQGISVFPARVNGSKKPVGEWKQYQQQRCPAIKLAEWFDRDNPHAIAVVCGEVSKNLLVLDLDDAELIDPFESQLESEHPDIYDSLVAIETGSGKRHLYFFCEQPFGPRQTFVKMADNKWAIEFRAEGNYVIGPGSPHSTHESNQPYHVVRGSLDEIPTCSAKQVRALIELAKSFEPTSGPSAAAEFGRGQGDHDGQIDRSRPGDDFDAETDWSEILSRDARPPVRAGP